MNDSTRCDIYCIRDQLSRDFTGFLVTRAGDIDAPVAFVADDETEYTDNGIRLAVAVARDPDGDWHRTRRTTPTSHDKTWLPDCRTWDTDPAYLIDLRHAGRPDSTVAVPSALFGAEATPVDDEDNATGPVFVLNPFCPVVLKRLERQRKVMLALA